MLKRRTTLCALVALLSVNAHAADDPYAAARKQWDKFDTYCTKCHNNDDFSGGFSFDGLQPEDLATHGKIYEQAILKLNAGMMPPLGQKQPTMDERKALVKALETSLDAVAAANPNPGSEMLHRLNRTEYANAIRDLLDLEINSADLLPKDVESSGFNNVASVLSVSPSFLEQYMLAAREVSVQAIGKPNAAPVSRVYKGAPNASENQHIDGLPLGTRGGMVVEHDFPADGDYDFSVSGLVGAGYVWGVMDENQLIITVDDDKVFQAKVGGKDDLRAVDLKQAEGVGMINDRFRNIRHFVKAGKHRVGVSFIMRSSAETIEPLHGFVPVDGMAVLVQGVSGGPRIDNITVAGPYNPKGVSETAARDKIFICRPAQPSEELACARRILGNLAQQAFRRPVTDDDLASPLQFYSGGREHGSFDDGIQKGLMAILASPKFLYRAHSPSGSSGVFALSDNELATRLAFFLWSSQPDNELIALAQANKLHESATLQQQVKRMLADPRANALVVNFAFQWLHVSGLEQVNPDKTIFPQFTFDLIPDFRKELELFIGEQFRTDRPVGELLTANYTYLNERLSLHYGLNVVRGGQFQRVTLKDPQRFGLLGKGAVLMTTSYANRTSPVIRGAWILDKLIGTPPPSPPPNVEAFPETQEGAVALTVRERLEKHRSNATCKTCHSIIDPLGLSLENYNSVGQWQLKDGDAGVMIDTSGTLTDGTPVKSPRDLALALTKDPERFASTFTRKLMIFALGRNLEYYDMPTVRKIVHNAAKDDYKLSALVLGIVQSDAFLRDKPVLEKDVTVATQ
ncbi:MAG TPA: DUF1592 domain-containing protein [Candidatus Acidoferrum sp.]|nr:DUF1592 domain-containing protein [Candidatus Acidoferrum sp.]